MKKRYKQELERINKSIPQHMLDRLMIKEDQFPTIKEIAERAQDDPDVPQEEKDRIKAMLDSGFLDKQVDVVDPLVEKEIDEYLNGEFEKARKLGRLPPPQKMPNINKKAQQLIRRNHVESIQNESTESEGEVDRESEEL